MNKIMILLVIVALFLLAGCQQMAEKSIEKKIEKETGYEPDVEIDKKQIAVESETGDIEAEVIPGEDAKVKIEGEIPVKKAVEWCKENEEWTLTKGASKMIVMGLADSGKYQGYCHVKYEAPEDSRLSSYDFYFDEEGNGYQVLNVNGQQIESKWPN